MQCAVRQQAAALAAAGVLMAGSLLPSAAQAIGLESVDILPSEVQTPQMFSDAKAATSAKLASADATFENSEVRRSVHHVRSARGGLAAASRPAGAWPPRAALLKNRILCLHR